MACKRAVAWNTCIADATVDRDPDRERAGPIFGRDGHVLGSEVLVLHMDEAVFFDARDPPLRVEEADEAMIDAAPKI